MKKQTVYIKLLFQQVPGKPQAEEMLRLRAYQIFSDNIY